MACVPQFDTMHPSMTLGANFNDRDLNYFCIEIKIRKQKCTFESFIVPKLEEYHSSSER